MPEVEGLKKEKEWIGVDLDGTLSEFHEEEYFGKYGPETIGKPIPEMVERVKKWIMEGKRVKIFTARASFKTAKHLGTQSWKMKKAVHQWLLEHLGFDLEVTHEKDFAMIELWDDISLVGVERNTGKICNTDLVINHTVVKKGTFILRCEPSVPIELRHQMGELIEQHGFDVHGSGEKLNGKSCDISFSKTVDLSSFKHKAIA